MRILWLFDLVYFMSTVSHTHVDACRPVALSHSWTMKSLRSWACPRSSQTRAAWIRAACCHSGLGARPHYDPLGGNVERRWLVRPASRANSRHLVVAMAGASTVLCLRWASRWLVRGVRERAFRLAARYARGARMAMGVEGCYTCLGNENDTVVFIVTGAVEFVAYLLDSRMHSRWSNPDRCLGASHSSAESLQCRCRVVEMFK